MSPDPSPQVSRRTALKVSAAGVVGVVAAGAVLAAQKPEPLAHGELKALTPVEHAQLTAICDTLCPGKPGVFPSSAELGLPELVDAHLATLDADTLGQLKVGIGLFDSALFGALGGERLCTISALSPAERVRAVAGWRDSSVGFRRTLYKGIAGLVQSLYWAHPRVQAGAGYAGPPDAAQLRRTYADNLVDYGALRATAKATGT